MNGFIRAGLLANKLSIRFANLIFSSITFATASLDTLKWHSILTFQLPISIQSHARSPALLLLHCLSTFLPLRYPHWPFHFHSRPRYSIQEFNPFVVCALACKHVFSMLRLKLDLWLSVCRFSLNFGYTLWDKVLYVTVDRASLCNCFTFAESLTKSFAVLSS
jgi:hypothetical protein